MTTTKPQFTVVLDKDLYDALEDFRFNNRFSSRGKALNYVLRAGMASLAEEYPELDLQTKIEESKKETDENIIRP